MEERLIELELRFMQQQKLLEELSDLVYSQQQIIDRLLGEMNQLKDQLPSLNRSQEEESPPPHY